MTPGIRLSQVDAILGRGFLIVLLLSLAGSALTYGTGNAMLHRIAGLLLFEEEGNLPTLFNFALLAANMAALGMVALFAFGGRSRWRWHWLFLSGFFLLMTYDEAAQVHERLNGVMARVVEADGYLGFAWVVPALALVVVLGVAFSRFLLALPRRSAGLFLLAGAIFVGGAVGVEMLGADHWTRHGWDNAAYSLLATLEESLEMTGLMVLLHATLGVLAGPGGVLRFAIRGGPPDLREPDGAA
ncbi:hypothetical protein KTN05_14155 [Paracoccus sp. Z118]|uniref:hypothetical protein n=1 Tax=Paracoccus sp. Z118 TaxID=2851017 RepID=UPI001C2B88D2|nr:hypothetical protein [Paracoccus sp. Z118]MBV0892978.1 hypothetical protein [Paracoccus sp. Z118]